MDSFTFSTESKETEKKQQKAEKKFEYVILILAAEWRS